MEEVEKRPLIAWCTTEPLFMFMADTLLSKYTDFVHRPIKLTTEDMKGLTVIVHWSKNCVSLGHWHTENTIPKDTVGREAEDHHIKKSLSKCGYPAGYLTTLGRQLSSAKVSSKVKTTGDSLCVWSVGTTVTHVFITLCLCGFQIPNKTLKSLSTPRIVSSALNRVILCTQLRTKKIEMNYVGKLNNLKLKKWHNT